jgi:hypothetical protein
MNKRGPKTIQSQPANEANFQRHNSPAKNAQRQTTHINQHTEPHITITHKTDTTCLNPTNGIQNNTQGLTTQTIRSLITKHHSKSQATPTINKSAPAQGSISVSNPYTHTTQNRIQTFNSKDVQTVQDSSRHKNNNVQIGAHRLHRRCCTQTRTEQTTEPTQRPAPVNHRHSHDSRISINAGFVFKDQR